MVCKTYENGPVQNIREKIHRCVQKSVGVGSEVYDEMFTIVDV